MTNSTETIEVKTKAPVFRYESTKIGNFNLTSTPSHYLLKRAPEMNTQATNK